MSKKTKETNVEPVAPKTYPHVALGMYPVFGPDGYTRYVVVEIPYDPQSGDVGFVKELCKDIREDSIDKFKQFVIDNKFFGGE